MKKTNFRFRPMDAVIAVIMVGILLVVCACNFSFDDKPSRLETTQDNEIEIGFEEPKDELPVSNPVPQFLSALGCPIDITKAGYETEEDLNRSSSMFDLQPGDIVCQPMESSEYSEIIASSEKEFQKTQNRSNFFGLGNLLPFSGGFNIKFSSGSSSSGFSYYIEIKAENKQFHEYAVNGNSPTFWASRLTPQTINDFYSLGPSAFLDRRGSVIVTEAWHGSKATMNWLYTGTGFTDKSQVKVGLNALYNGISAGTGWANSSAAAELSKNSTFTYHVNNAIVNFQSADQFNSGYGEWLARATEAPSFVGGTYMGIWDIFMAYAPLNPERAAEITQRAEALRAEFFLRAFELAGKLDFLTVHTREFSASGNDAFYCPAELNGTLRQFMIYCFGAPGAGGGDVLSGTLIRNYHPGAGGGSPAGLRFGFLTDGDVAIDLYVGRAGSGGGFRDTSASATSGRPGTSGEASWVKYNDVTLTAGGGQGGGEPGGRRGGAGGTASSYPGPQFTHWVRLEGTKGGDGGNSPGAGGAGVSIDGFSSGDGGRGGSKGSGHAGSSNGLIVIRWFSLE